MSKIASKTIALVVTLLLAISFVVTSSFAQTISNLSAADADQIFSTEVTNRVKYGSTFTIAAGTGITVKTPGGTIAVAEDEDSTVLDNAELTEPKEVKATQVGVYEITYSFDANNEYKSYTYNVESYMDYEYLFVVDGYGAAIPTYWQKSSEDRIALPSATLYYYDEDLEKYLPDSTTSEISCRVTKGSDVQTYDKEQLDAGATITPDVTGIYFITYYAEVANGDNLFSEEYTMQVQDSFSDSRAPILSISDVPSASSSNTQISLPVATVSDVYDARVNTSITVTHDYGNGEIEVPEAVVDLDTGYAKYNDAGVALYYLAANQDTRTGYTADSAEADGLAKTTDPAKAVKATFDNNNFMSFYPTDDDEYRVTYSAMDSTGRYKDSISNKTVDYVYTIRVSDTTAPVYDVMDESLIPSNWGRNSVWKYSENTENNLERVTDTNIQFPIPELNDNKSADEELRVSFTLADPQSKTVMSFDNIYSTNAADARYNATGDFSAAHPNRSYYFFRYWLSDDYTTGKFTVNESTGQITDNGSSFSFGDNAYMLIYYSDDASAVTKGFFNFNLWTASGSQLGQYTATYRARDVQGNSATRTYNINVQSRFEDSTLPSVDFNEPDYFAFRKYESEQRITDISATDSNDARLDVEMYLVFNETLSAVDGKGNLDFDGNINPENIDDWINNDRLVEIDPTSGTVTATLELDGDDYNFTVTDIDGKKKTVALDITKNVYVAIKATDSAGNSSHYVRAVKVVDGTNADSKTYAPEFGNVNMANGRVSEEYNFGSFSIAYADAADRNYTGFEVYVQRVSEENTDGSYVPYESEPLNNVSFETYSDNRETSGTNTLHVDNIRFTPTRSGEYMIVIRGFHVSGNSSVAVFFRTVDGTSSGGKPVSAVLGDQLEYNTTYSLPTNEYTAPDSWAGEKAGLLRSITGGRFTLMGSEFTAKSTTTFSFNDYPFEYTNNQGTIITDPNNEAGEVALAGLINYNYVDNTTGVYYGKSLKDDLIAGNHTTPDNGSYTSSFTDSQTATFHLLGVMPTYTAITTTTTNEGVSSTEYGYVTLPNISASSANGNATEITCTVTDPDGNADVEVYDAETAVDDLPEGYLAGDENENPMVGNQFMFEATLDGEYTVTYTATLNNQSASATYTIKAGDIIAPDFTATLGRLNGTSITNVETVSASVGDTFDFSIITVNGETSTTDFEYSKQLISPEDETLADVRSATRINSGSSYTLSLSGTYRVVYSVTDAAGNTTILNFEIVVTSSSSNVSTEAITTLSVVLIVVGVILIAGIIIYLIRFRKRKSTSKV